MAAGAVARVMAGPRAPERRDVVVDLGPRSYEVVVGAELLDELGTRVAGLGLRGRAVLVTSTQVARLYREPALRALKTAGFATTVVELPDGEEQKSLDSLRLVYDRLLDAGVERRTPIVALGGGVVTDLAGFAAATLLRGLPTVLVPTTLLGQVDAAIGGKTAVNHARGKNLVGAFHQPRLVLADVGVLSTLPRRELVAGMAEVIKYGVIGDPALFGRLENRLEDMLSLHDQELVTSVVAASARQKAAVVADDEREETGGRAVLNFGHTVGHAIEAATGYQQLLHGEAVAIGMVAAARISERLGICDAGTGARIENLLERAGLPTRLPDGVAPDALARAMQSDKKSAGGRIRFVGVADIGRTEFVDLSVQDIVARL